MRQNLISFFLLLFLHVSAMAITVRGRIVSGETGEPVTGATIRVDGTSYNAVTGLDGSFSIKDIPVGEYTLTISMIGYATVNRNLKVEEKNGAGSN